MESLTYRTAGVWGGGNGSDLTAAAVDNNFFALFSAVTALEDHAETSAGIDYIVQTGGNQLFIHLTNHQVLGPFVLPTAQFNPRGAWAADTSYAAFDLVSDAGSLYIVTTNHTSASTFNVNATNGLGQALYVLVLASPDAALPALGTPGQELVISDGSPAGMQWRSRYIRLVSFIEGQPNAGETIFVYNVVENMTLHSNLPLTAASQISATVTEVSYTLYKNGAAIGQINFMVSPSEVEITFTTDIEFVPGDIVTLVAPTTPDVTQAGISFTIVAELT